jgi:hypothetical protein
VKKVLFIVIAAVATGGVLYATTTRFNIGVVNAYEANFYKLKPTPTATALFPTLIPTLTPFPLTDTPTVSPTFTASPSASPTATGTVSLG